MATRMIMLEFNELCPSLLKKWMASGQLPNFKRFYDSSDAFVTEADELKAPNLEPWIQWYSVHTGLPFRLHQVFHLTDGPRADHLDIWSALQNNGKKVWNCSSMNARRLKGEDALFLPDPWCDSQEPNPKELAPFARFVAHQVQEYSNKENIASRRLVMEFGQFMLTHGLSFDTVVATTTQLLRDFLSGGKTSWQRAAILDRFLFDVFKHYYANERPDFSTYFINSTAHFQHCYWRHMSPDAFSVLPTPEETDRYADAILFGYKQMDKIVGRFISLAGNDAALILATALSQQPFLRYEAIGGQHFYRPRKIVDLLEMFGLKPQKVEPVMTHQYLLRFASPAEAAASRQILSRATLNGEQVFGFDVADDASLYVGCEIRTAVDKSAIMELGGNLQNAAFFELFYQIEGVKSGCHHPDGCLWIRLGEHREHAEKVSLLDIFPTILDFFQIPTQSCIGKSLLPLTGSLSESFRSAVAA